MIPTSNNSSGTAPKQIKLKLSPGNIVNTKMFKNLKIQRNINTKGFTVLNTSQIVQIQSIPSIQQEASSNSRASTNESTKTDWEQELDDANRTKAAENVLQIDDNNMIIEESTEDVPNEVNFINEESAPTTTVYGKIINLF